MLSEILEQEKQVRSELVTNGLVSAEEVKTLPTMAQLREVFVACANVLLKRPEIIGWITDTSECKILRDDMTRRANLLQDDGEILNVGLEIAKRVILNEPDDDGSNAQRTPKVQTNDGNRTAEKIFRAMAPKIRKRAYLDGLQNLIKFRRTGNFILIHAENDPEIGRFAISQNFMYSHFAQFLPQRMTASFTKPAPASEAAPTG
jgi:hypothetical protein